MKISLLLRAAAFSLVSVSPALAGTYTVNTLADTPSTGSLRWAVLQANANPNSTIDFSVAGTIALGAALPEITAPVTIDGSTAPTFKAKGSPVVGIDFNGARGLVIAKTARGSVIQSLSLAGASNAGLTLAGSQVTVAGNYIGLNIAGKANGNSGDGVKVLGTSHGNLIGGLNPVTGIRYFNNTNPNAFPVQPVTGWQGLRNYGTSTQKFLLCGTSDNDGLLYIGPMAGGGKSYKVIFPSSTSTSVYGPDNVKNGVLRLVGSYKTGGSTAFNYGFVWEGTPDQLPSGGKFTTIDYPGSKAQYTHSTMGGLAVGNAGNPSSNTQVAYIYDVESGAFVTNIVYPGSKTTSAYGIWSNGAGKYTICGGYSALKTSNLADQSRPLPDGRAYLVDYDSRTKAFSNWTTFRYRGDQRGAEFITHFEGISSAEKGVYTMSADSAKRGSKKGPLQGSWVSVRRNGDGSFSKAQWVDLNYPGQPVGISSSNSVYGNRVVGLVIDSSPFAFQAVVDIGFTLSNVISANGGNGIGLHGSKNTIVSQNYIGTNAAGTAGLGNAKNGVLVTGRSKSILIGGQEAGSNNPTGSENKTKPVFIVPPQGNLISGNLLSGVLIERRSTNTVLSGNFIGTRREGNAGLGNGRDGVTIVNAPGNSLLGCTVRQNPFVFYNVISGNVRDGVRLVNSNDITVRANFLGISADNASIVPNGGDGLNVTGSSKNTQVGGIIPLGNVISGNNRNGIAVRDTASGFISFNTFGGGFAFGGAAPNGANGILVTSSGGNNLIRTCILSGNLGNGLEISGDGTGVQIIDTACGTNTDLSAALANGGCGVMISGRAHNNYIGGFRPSVETRTHFAGNKGYGIAVIDQARDNFIFNSNVGLGFAVTDGLEPSIPNELGGIYLGRGTSATTIGGGGIAFRNKISTNKGGGLAIIASEKNSVIGNQISRNADFGVYATGPCDGTAITSNTITGNGSGAGANVEVSSASGVTYQP